ncbi:MAG: hypothetical protein AAF108_07630 [Planctomycetota bacterium]
MRFVLATAVITAAGAVSAQQVDITGGQTSVLLDTALLSAAAGLDLSSVSDDVIAPGEIEGSVAFGINARDGSLPTTFEYDASDFLGSFSGTIEHAGSVFFNDDSVEVGDFTIGFDAGRVGGDRSGFFVESTTGVAAILFDVGAPSLLDAQASGLIIEADLLVSAEFAGFLGDTALTGADVGDARVNAVPAPGAAASLLAAAGFGVRRRR